MTRRAYFNVRGCVSPASWLPLTAGGEFMQPLIDSLALQTAAVSMRSALSEIPSVTR